VGPLLLDVRDLEAVFWLRLYTALKPNPSPSELCPRVTAVAKDLPGNSEGLVWQNY
jgi:hypothetical protein